VVSKNGNNIIKIFFIRIIKQRSLDLKILFFIFSFDLFDILGNTISLLVSSLIQRMQSGTILIGKHKKINTKFLLILNPSTHQSDSPSYHIQSSHRKKLDGTNNRLVHLDPQACQVHLMDGV